MDLNEFLTIDKDTTLDDLDIMINELDILILLCRKTLSLKKLDIKNNQYEKELLNFVQADSRRINVDEFIMENDKISLIAYNANKPFFSNNTLESKLLKISIRVKNGSERIFSHPYKNQAGRLRYND